MTTKPNTKRFSVKHTCPACGRWWYTATALRFHQTRGLCQGMAKQGFAKVKGA